MNKIKERIQTFLKQTGTIVKKHPVEVFFILFFVGLGIYIYESKNNILLPALGYAPALFLFTYIINKQTEKSRWRWSYFLSAFFLIPLLLIKADLDSPTYPATLVIIQLIYLIQGQARDNHLFMEKVIRYVRAWVSGGFLASASWLLTLSVFYSIRYIFEIWNNGEERFLAYAACILFVGVMPLLFLMFNEKESEKGELNKLLALLINYVLSPALLIYTTILYIYFFKITVLWSLPKGAIAYIVISFVSVTFLLKGCQPFLQRRYYDPFFRYAGWIMLPALAMFWVGTCYRLNQYGFTEPRVYLVAIGLILTVGAVLFIFRRMAHYVYIAAVAIGILVSVTYIPGFSAKDIERRFQTARNNWPMKETQKQKAEHVFLYNRTPLELKGYQTISFLNGTEEKGMRFELKNEILSLYDERNKLIFQEKGDIWLARQMQQAGLTPTDSLTANVAPVFFCMELDSALVVVEQITVSRDLPDTPYTLHHITGGCFLKKEISLQRNNTNDNEKQ